MSISSSRRAAALAIAVVTLAGLVLSPDAAIAQKKDEPIESYSALVISSSPGSRVRARLSISRWSTDEERAQLLDVLKAGDSRAFADALGKLEQVGTFQLEDTMGYPVRYARKFTKPDGSWQLIAGTDRPISGKELLGTSTKSDYYLSIIEIDSDPDGILQAVVSPGTELIWDEENQQIDLENWSGIVYALSHVRQLK